MKVISKKNSMRQLQSIFKEEIELQWVGRSVSDGGDVFCISHINGEVHFEGADYVRVKIVRDDMGLMKRRRRDYKGTLFMYKYGYGDERFPTYCYKRFIKESDTEKISVYEAFEKVEAKVEELRGFEPYVEEKISDRYAWI